MILSNTFPFSLAKKSSRQTFHKRNFFARDED